MGEMGGIMLKLKVERDWQGVDKANHHCPCSKGKKMRE